MSRISHELKVLTSLIRGIVEFSKDFLFQKTHYDVFWHEFLATAAHFTHLSVGIFNGWDIRVSEGAMDKSEDQTGFPHTSGSKNDDSVIIALFWHIFQKTSTISCTKEIYEKTRKTTIREE